MNFNSDFQLSLGFLPLERKKIKEINRGQIEWIKKRRV
jgi:hypothetical protein